MQPLLRSCALFVLLLRLYVAASAGVETPPWQTLLAQIDTAYHYPEREGARDLVADVTSSLEQILEAQYGSFERHPIRITFYWRAPDRARFVVQIASLPDDASAQAFRRGIESVFWGRAALVAPRPLASMLADYACTVQPGEGDTLIHGVAKSATPALRSFDLWFDPVSLRIRQTRQVYRDATYLVRPEYITREGRYLLRQERLVFHDLLRETTIDYAKVSGTTLWLPVRMTFATRSKVNPRVEAHLEIGFSNWRVNQGVPETLFRVDATH